MSNVTSFVCRRIVPNVEEEREKPCTDGQRVFLRRRFTERGYELAQQHNFVMGLTNKSDWRHLTRGQVVEIVAAIDKVIGPNEVASQ